MAAQLSLRRTGAVGQAPVRRPACVRAPLHVCASFKNKENIDLSKVAKYQTSDADSGSTAVQIARLSARVEQISKHLIANRKDTSSRRGLDLVLSQRKRLLKYMYRIDRDAYDRICSELGIRGVITKDKRTAAEKAASVAAQKK